MKELMNFKEVLMSVDKLYWDDALFLPKDKNWSLDSLGYVFNLDELNEDEDEDEDVPKVAINNNLIYVVSVSEIQDIVDNAKQQRQCSELDLFEAFLYYYNNDAFITFI